MTVIAQDDHLTTGAWAACGPHRATNFGLFTSILRRFYGRLCGPNSSSRSLSFALFIIGRIFERHNAEMSFEKLKRGLSAWRFIQPPF